MHCRLALTLTLILTMILGISLTANQCQIIHRELHNVTINPKRVHAEGFKSLLDHRSKVISQRYVSDVALISEFYCSSQPHTPFLRDTYEVRTP